MHRNRDQYLVLQYFGDGLAVATGLFVAWWLRFGSGIDPGAIEATNYTSQFWWAFAIWMFALQLAGAFTPHPKIIGFNRARRLLRGSALAVMLCAVRNYFFREADVARLLYPVSFVTVSTCLVGGRMILQWIITRFLVTRVARKRIVIAGLGPVGLRLAARCRMKRELGYELIGFVCFEESRIGQRIGSFPILGTHEDLRRIIRDNKIEEVFVTTTDVPNDIHMQLFVDSEKEKARVAFVPSLAEMLRSSIYYDEIAGVPLYSMKDTPLMGFKAATKRGFDIVFAGGGLIALMPFFLALSWLVRRSSSGPVLYKQTRLGLDGQQFKIYKFRTMRIDAEDELPRWGNQDDPRATPIGRWMRRWNVDELPQLWNVVRGDMSLVGPRPERPFYVDRFREVFPRYMARHSVKTGMTGWAQVHGLRGDTSIQQRLRYDLYYIENWSLWLDIKILMMTFMPGRRRRRRDALRSASGVAIPLMEQRVGTSSSENISNHSRVAVASLTAGQHQQK